MKKYLINIIAFLTLCLFITGCGCSKDKTELKKAVDDLKFNENLTSYTINVDIKGILNNKNISDNVKIGNYNNTQFTIYLKNNNKNNEDIVLYLIEGKLYEKYRNKNEKKYIQSKRTTIYKETEIYFSSINSAKDLIKLDDEVIGNKTYSVYSYDTTKEIMNSIMKCTSLGELNFTRDISTRLYLDSDNNIYKVIYYLNDGLNSKTSLKMEVMLTDINSIKEIILN